MQSFTPLEATSANGKSNSTAECGQGKDDDGGELEQDFRDAQWLAQQS